MNIQIASDLHLEFDDNREYVKHNPITPRDGAEVLVLAGDIVSKKYAILANEFFEQIKRDFKHVIYIPGNHEFYGSPFKHSENTFIDRYDNLTHLNNNTIVIEGVRFICTTMWSGITYEASAFLNDYKIISGFSVEVENEAHKIATDFIKSELEKDFDGKTVVVTHHLPSDECIDLQFKGSSYNSGFSSDQSELLEMDIDLWITGHSHTFRCDNINDTVIVRNPLGYTSEWTGFLTDCTVEV